jgi:hypothetical protein
MAAPDPSNPALGCRSSACLNADRMTPATSPRCSRQARRTAALRSTNARLHSRPWRRRSPRRRSLVRGRPRKPVSPQAARDPSRDDLRHAPEWRCRQRESPGRGSGRATRADMPHPQNVGVRIVWMAQAVAGMQGSAGFGHDLHQAHRSLGRQGTHVDAAPNPSLFAEALSDNSPTLRRSGLSR